MIFEDLKDPQLQERLKNAKTPEEILEIAKAEGMELTDDQLQSISGGWCSDLCIDCSDVHSSHGPLS